MTVSTFGVAVNIALSLCPVSMRPHDCPVRHVWNGGCLSEIPRLGWAGPWPGARTSGLGVWMDMEQRGGFRSWPGTTGKRGNTAGPSPSSQCQLDLGSGGDMWGSMSPECRPWNSDSLL